MDFDLVVKEIDNRIWPGCNLDLVQMKYFAKKCLRDGHCQSLTKAPTWVRNYGLPALRETDNEVLIAYADHIEQQINPMRVCA